MMSWRFRFCLYSISYVSSHQMLESDFAEGLSFASVCSTQMRVSACRRGMSRGTWPDLHTMVRVERQVVLPVWSRPKP